MPDYIEPFSRYEPGGLLQSRAEKVVLMHFRGRSDREKLVIRKGWLPNLMTGTSPALGEIQERRMPCRLIDWRYAAPSVYFVLMFRRDRLANQLASD